jgi:hypothetical protein
MPSLPSPQFSRRTPFLNDPSGKLALAHLHIAPDLYRTSALAKQKEAPVPLGSTNHTPVFFGAGDPC